VNLLNTEKECRNAYRDILLGRSFVKEKGIYIKHFKEEDIGKIDCIYQNSIDEGKKIGLVFERDQLKWLKKQEYWVDDDEEVFINAKLAVKDAEEHKMSLALDEQREKMDEVIEEKNEELSKVAKERAELIGITLEKYASQKVNEKYVYYSFYKEKELKELCYTEEEFDNLTNEGLAEIVGIYNRIVSVMSEENIKRIAVNAFFLNPYFICDDDPVRFFGKNVLELTIYQMNLFSRGKFYKSIINEGKSPPDEIYERPDYIEKLARFYENAFNMLQADRRRMEAEAKAAANKNAIGRRHRA